jgi:hypothetical protein
MTEVKDQRPEANTFGLLFYTWDWEWGLGEGVRASGP